MNKRQANKNTRQDFLTGLCFQPPTVKDAADIWRLAKASGRLELNSAYSYLLLCKHFRQTCIIARHSNRLCGFVTAFIPPAQNDTIFVWQVAVDEQQRGKGLGKTLLMELLRRNVYNNVRFLEATVTPANHPSKSLFVSLARELNTQCNISVCFPAHYFPLQGHEEELTCRIGPFQFNF